jgi:hypothetical protein
MHPMGVAMSVSPLTRRLLAVLALICMLVASAGLARSSIVRAEPAPLKAVFISGPTHGQTDENLAYSEELALQAESLGMEVHRVYHPNATWLNVMAAIEGANLVVYMGHGYGWPSPYPPFREKFQDGLGLNPYEGGSKSDVDYYGARYIRDNWHLAPNAVVFLNHLCYAAGNAEPGMAKPSYDLARQRVDNMASGYLAAGAAAVFAYSWQSFRRSLSQLFTTNMTMEEIFKTPGSKPKAYFGWIGDNPRTFDSVRNPGAQNLLDPDDADGYLRALTGKLSITAAQWRGEEPGTWHAPAFQATPDTPAGLAGTAYNNRWVRLSWEPVTVNYFGGATYTVYRNGKKVGSAGKATSYDNQPATVGSYTYQVKSVDPAGFESPLSGPISVQVVENAGQALPNATAAPTASPTKTPSPTPSAGASATPTSAPSATPTGAPSATPTQAPQGTASPTPSATPTAAPVSLLPPAGLQAVIQPELKVAVSWSASAGAVKYKVYRNGYLMATTKSRSYVSAPWLPGYYKFQVLAVDANGVKSSKSPGVTVRLLVDGTPAEVSDTTPPTAVTGLTAESLVDRHIQLNWGAATDSGPSPVGYLVIRGGTLVGRVWGTTSFVDVPGKVGTYTYKVIAFDGYGNAAPAVKIYAEAAL